MMFSYNVENMPIHRDLKKSTYSISNIRKRAQWKEKHVHWLGHFLEIDIQALSLISDLILGDPRLIFGISDDSAQNNPNPLKNQQVVLNEDRMAILMNILGCKKKNSLRRIADTWMV